MFPPSKLFLRMLIVSEIAVGIASVIAYFITEPMLPEPLRDFVAAEFAAEPTSRDFLMLTLGIPLIVLYLVAIVGLYFFWRPARFLYILSLIVGLLLIPLFGPYVDAGWGSMLEQMAITIGGAILALVYFSPLKDLFEKPERVVPH